MTTNNRWCIVTTLRSGSNYLADILQENLLKDCSYVMHLGELCLPNNWGYQDSQNSELINFGRHDSVERIEFTNLLFDKLENDSKIGAVMRYLPPIQSFELEHIHILKKLQSLNFKFIKLNRNIFDKTISLSFASCVNLWHRIKTENGDVITGDGNSTYIDNIVPIDIPLLTFAYRFGEQKLQEYYGEMYLKNIEYITMTYETLHDDCQLNNINSQIFTPQQKLYDKPYESLISNYSAITEFYKRITNE